MTEEIKTVSDCDTTRTDDTAPDVAVRITDGTEQAPAVGEQAEDETFDGLIRTKYKDAFGKKVSEIVQSRLKSAREATEKQEKVLTALSSRLGIDNDFNTWQTVLGTEPRAEQIEALRSDFPEIDVQEVTQNRQFSRLTCLGTDTKTAYIATHFDQILAMTRRAAYAEAEGRIMAHLAQNGARPTENGVDRKADTLHCEAVSQMTEKQIDEICKRVTRGERIVLR